MANDIIEQLRKRFGKRQSFSRQELYAFYTEFNPDLKETTFRWIIYNLKKKQIISSISKGLFTLAFKPVFKPNIEKATKIIYLSIEKQFPMLKFCVWTTQIVSEFMLHVLAKHITILQMEREALEPVYDFLKTKKIGDIFIQPKEKEIERYIYESDNAIVLLPLVTKSPLQKIDEVQTTTLEKLIVDLFSDKKLFAAFQGSELIHIINTAYNRYAIDFTTLVHYANRRRKDVDLKNFLKDKTDIPKNILND
ncbi:MAG: hypothetical protein H3C41_03640 [Bacteroidales bacterium]|nr:hypothetical protein [Bacteroidales bacterium]